MKVKTTNALMKYLREQHNISIDGSKDKKNLRNIGKYWLLGFLHFCFKLFRYWLKI